MNTFTFEYTDSKDCHTDKANNYYVIKYSHDCQLNNYYICTKHNNL